MTRPKKTWRERIDQAAEQGRFDLYDHIDAGEWKSCAVGELKDIARVAGFDCPTDHKLDQLGLAFYHAVREGTPEQACEVYRKIQERAAELAKPEVSTK